MRLFRILTEDRPHYRENAIQVVRQSFPGFTMLQGTGYYKGVQEPCLVIEIYEDSSFAGAVHQCAERIRVANKQESVLVQELKTGGT